MEDLDKTRKLPPISETRSADSRSLDATAAKTAPLPRFDPASQKTPAEKKEEEFRLGQSRILQRLAANAPLSEILSRLVLLIESQSPDMLCSVLLLSEDGEHMRHGAAPSLPKEYVAAIDGGP